MTKCYFCKKELPKVSDRYFFAMNLTPETTREPKYSCVDCLDRQHKIVKDYNPVPYEN